MSTRMIWVIATGKEGNRVGLWERDPAHPHGEVWVAGNKPVLAARTPRILDALRRGVIDEIAAPEDVEQALADQKSNSDLHIPIDPPIEEVDETPSPKRTRKS